MSNYLKVMSRKRTWTPVAVDKGQVIEGSEDTLKRCLALRTLELPVKEMLQQGQERELPDDPGVITALRSNQADEDKHDRALQFIVDVHGVDERAEREAERIRSAWLSDPSHPILKTAILERSVFFVHSHSSGSTATWVSAQLPVISAVTSRPILDPRHGRS